MSQLLAVDRLPYRALSGWVAFVRAGLVWLLFCLPIVTGPAATVVLLRTVRLIISGHSAPGFADSWRLLRELFGPSLRLGALLGVGWLVSLSAVLGPAPGGAWRPVLPFVVIPVAVTWVLATQWCFALLEDGVREARAALRISYLRAIRRPDLAALSAAGTAGLVVVGWLLPTTVWVPYWLSVPAIAAALITVTCRWAAPPVPTSEGTTSGSILTEKHTYLTEKHT